MITTIVILAILVALEAWVIWRLLKRLDERKEMAQRELELNMRVMAQQNRKEHS